MTRKSSVCYLLALVLCVLSCTRTAQPLSQEKTILRLQAPVSAAMSKTWIDASAGGSVAPVYWSVGDQIWVNGVVSSPLEADPTTDRMASASFYLTNVSAPYTVLYPHSAYAGKGEDGSLLLDIPSSQEWKDGSFAEGAALLYGYSESEEAPVQMQNLCGAITFTLKDDSSVKVQSLSITSLSEGKPIAGRFSLDKQSLRLTGAGANSARIDMEFPDDNFSITPEGTSFFFSLPAGDYPDGFLIRLKDENKHILRCWWLRPAKDAEAGVTLGAGKLVVFAAQDYDPDAREICSAEEWEEFVSAYNEGGDAWKADWLSKDGSIKIGDDFTAESLTRITTLADILDGCGHTVTVTAGTTPLVKTLTGTIRNLTVAGANIPSDSSTDGATIFVTNLNGGVIEHCCNQATITLANHARATIAGPFVRTFTAGRVEDCVNEADFLLGCNIEAANRYFLVGGIVGLVKDLTAGAVIKDCVNKGKITAMAVTTATAAKTPLQAAYGGIVGSIIGGTEDKYLLIEGCVNEGDISADFSPVPTNTTIAVSGVGGIVGTAMQYNGGLTFKWYSSGTTRVTSQDGVYFQMKDCTSKGKVHNGLCSKLAHGDPNADFAGGLIGVANGLGSKKALIENCAVVGVTVEATQETFYTRSSFCMVSGGLAGFGGHVHFKDCTVDHCKIGSPKFQAYAAAGGIGMAPVTFIMENCRIFADVYHIRSAVSGVGYIDGHSAIGFVLSTKKGPSGASGTGQGGMRDALVNPEGSSITGCSFGGSITTNPTLVEYNKSSSPALETVTLSQSSFAKYITCDSFTGENPDKKPGLPEYEQRNIASMFTISDNQYWNGQ